jgi:phage tail tape-measure protein
MADEKRNPDDVKQAEHDANRDPLSGRAGAHPVGTGIGAAAGGAAAGAAIGTVAGPVGTAVGTAVGAIVGGLAGKGIAESVDPTEEHGYWRQNYATRPYADKNATYDEYAPAYQYGWESAAKNPNTTFEQSESTLRQDWEKAKGKSTLEWDRAKEAARDSWNRVSTRSRRGQ